MKEQSNGAVLLREVKESTEKVFTSVEEGLSLPAPAQIYKDRLEAYSEACLEKQKASLLFEMRCDQAQRMGFQRLKAEQMVEMLMGQSHTKIEEGKERHNYEYLYFHHTDEVKTKTDWGGMPTQFVRIDKLTPWFVPPFSKKEIWRLQFSKLDYLKREIPYGVVLRINEIKKLKLFNVFNCLAPMEAWERKTDIDPIIVASIWEMPPFEAPNTATAGQVAHFFLAQW